MMRATLQLKLNTLFNRRMMYVLFYNDKHHILVLKSSKTGLTEPKLLQRNSFLFCGNHHHATNAVLNLQQLMNGEKSQKISADS